MSCFAVKDVGQDKKDDKPKTGIFRADTDYDDNLDVKTEYRVMVGLGKCNGNGKVLIDVAWVEGHCVSEESRALTQLDGVAVCLSTSLHGCKTLLKSRISRT